MPETSMNPSPEGADTQKAVATLIAELELPADEAEMTFLATDFLAIRSSTATLYSDAMEDLLR